MKPTLLLLLPLLLLPVGASTLQAQDLAGYWEGTIQATRLNETYIMSRGIKAGNDETTRMQNALAEAGNTVTLSWLKQAKLLDANPLVMSITTRQSGTAEVDTVVFGPASAPYVAQTIEGWWNDVQGLRADGFDLIGAGWKGAVDAPGSSRRVTARLRSDGTLVGEWSVSESGNEVIAGVFAVTRTWAPSNPRSGSNSPSNIAGQPRSEADRAGTASEQSAANDPCAGKPRTKSPFDPCNDIIIGQRPPGSVRIGNVPAPSEILEQAPPGLGGVGEVPGPANLPEAIVGILGPGLIAVLAGLKNILDGGAATVVPPPASEAPPPPSGYGPEHDQAISDQKDAQSKYEETKKQWDDLQKTIDKNDPNYERTRKQYEDYIEYQRQRAQEAGNRADALASQARQAQDSPQTIEWTSPGGRTYVLEKQADGNYVNTLTGGEVGAGKLEDWKQRTAQIEQEHRAFSDEQMDKMRRGDTAQDRALEELKARTAERDKLLQNLSTIEKGVIFGSTGAGDLYKAPGDPGNILDRVKELRTQLTESRTFDKDRYDRVNQAYRDATSGRTMTEDKLPSGNELIRDVINDTVANTVKEFVTGKKEDGSVSWLGIGARTLTAAVTAGASEMVMTPASALDTLKEYVDTGGDSAWGGFKKALGDVLVGEAIGRGAQVVGHAAGATSTMVKEIIKDAAESGNSVAKGIVNGVSAVKAAAAGAGELTTKVLGGPGKVVRVLIDDVQSSLSTGGKAVPRKIYDTSSVGGAPRSIRPASSPAASAAPAQGKAVRAATSAEGKAASTAAPRPSGLPASVNKPVSAAEATANRAARAEARAGRQFDVDKASGVNVQDHTRGMTTPAQKHAQMIADKNGVKIDVRPTTKYANEWISSGKAVPKEEWCKCKTINDLDVQLGAKVENKGLAGYFKPKTPVQGKMSDEEFKRLMKRYEERSKEFKDQFDHLTECEKEGRCYVKDGVVIDTKSSKPYTGDHDVFEIRDATTGKPLPRYQVDSKGHVLLDEKGKPILNPVREQILKDLRQPPFGARHGAHMDWKYDHLSPKVPKDAPVGTRSEFEIAQGVDKGVLNKHIEEGGEPLVTFGADQPPEGSWFNPPEAVKAQLLKKD